MPEYLYTNPRKKKKKKKKKATPSIRNRTRRSLMSGRPQNRPRMNAGFVNDLYRPPPPRIGY